MPTCIIAGTPGRSIQSAQFSPRSIGTVPAFVFDPSVGVMTMSIKTSAWSRSLKLQVWAQGKDYALVRSADDLDEMLRQRTAMDRQGFLHEIRFAESEPALEGRTLGAYTLERQLGAFDAGIVLEMLERRVGDLAFEDQSPVARRRAERVQAALTQVQQSAGDPVVAQLLHARIEHGTALTEDMMHLAGADRMNWGRVELSPLLHRIAKDHRAEVRAQVPARGPHEEPVEAMP